MLWQSVSPIIDLFYLQGHEERELVYLIGSEAHQGINGARALMGVWLRGFVFAWMEGNFLQDPDFGADYKCLKVVGKGGSSTVYKGVLTNTQHYVAIKQIDTVWNFSVSVEFQQSPRL